MKKQNTFGILINKIFNVYGTLSHEQWTRDKFQLFFDLLIDSFAYPYAKICRIEVNSAQNVMVHFPMGYFLSELPPTPSIEQLDNFLEDQETALAGWINKRQHHEHPSDYLKLVRRWLFFRIIRRIFDFTWGLWLNKEQAKNLKELCCLQKGKIRFWELLTAPNMISKVWFFELIIELEKESKKYVLALDDLLEQGKLSVKSSTSIERIMDEIEKPKIDLGFPVYVSEGEVVILRKFRKNEISGGFIDRTQSWFTILQKILEKRGYILTYQWPYGNHINRFPIEICLSFKGTKFKAEQLKLPAEKCKKVH